MFELSWILHLFYFLVVTIIRRSTFPSLSFAKTIEYQSFPPHLLKKKEREKTNEILNQLKFLGYWLVVI